MASSGVMKHPSCLSCSLTNLGHPVLLAAARPSPYTTWPWGDQAADEHLQRLEGQHRPLGPAHEQQVQLHRHRRRLPQLRPPDVRRRRPDGIEGPDEAVGQDRLGQAIRDHRLVDLVRRRYPRSRRTPPGSRTTTSSTGSAAAAGRRSAPRPPIRRSRSRTGSAATTTASGCGRATTATTSRPGRRRSASGSPDDSSGPYL